MSINIQMNDRQRGGLLGSCQWCEVNTFVQQHMLHVPSKTVLGKRIEVADAHTLTRERPAQIEGGATRAGQEVAIRLHDHVDECFASDND